jgi:predicted nuclease of restriction endonuclease-like RecB superfamily
MLTSEHAIVEFKQGRAHPDRLTQNTHRHYLKYARQMLLAYTHGLGKTRRELHRQIESILIDEPNCPIRRTQSFCKLLDDKSTFLTDPQGRASRLRLELFSAAADFHPLVKVPDQLFEHEEKMKKAEIAEKIGIPPEQLESQLYADVLSFQRLEKFDGYPDPAALLARYNVAQLQACLYRARRITVRATRDFTNILRYAKLARLLHQIEQTGPSQYLVDFTGPASILHETRRYGVNFARFLPALLACKGWRLTASLQTPWHANAKLVLSDQDGFTSHLPAPSEFDSRLEETFARRFGEQREGWHLIREGRILHERQKVFVPDFVFRHEDGTEVLMEIVGFWTPQYLDYKRAVLRQFQHYNILLAIPERSLRPDAALGENILVYKTALKIKQVLEKLESTRL